MSTVRQECLLAWFDPQSVEHFELSTFGLTHCGDFKRMSIMEWVLFVVNSILYDLGTIELSTIELSNMRLPNYCDYKRVSLLKWVLFVKNAYLLNLSALSWVLWDATKKTHFYDARMCTTRRERSCFRIEDYRLSTLSWVLLDWRIAPITSVRVCWVLFVVNSVCWNEYC